jgi:hypothetical protein
MTGNPKLEARRARLAGRRLLENNTHGARIWKHCHWCVYASARKTLKLFSLIDCISVAVDRMQRNFEPMRKQVEAWQKSELTDVTAKVVIYEVFVGRQAGSTETSRPHGP